MARDYTKVLLVSANVGSIFEDPDRMLPVWLKEFLSAISELDPDVLAVHCQEVGGKNYEDSMQHVNAFIKTMLAAEEMQQYDKARIFLDEDFTAVDKFTALGSLYFVHQCVQNATIWDFQESKFVPLRGREVLSGNIETIPIKEKAKFPQEFFPDFKWSRKGFIRTRWNVNNSVFDLINIHLFHDASNIVAMESSPSAYTSNRQRALQYTLERIAQDSLEKVPYFIFGDFNFRLDTHGLVQKLTEDTTVQQVTGKKNDVSQIVYRKQNNGKAVLTVGKKAFDHHDDHSNLFINNYQTLREFDKELDYFKGQLFEYDFNFPPSEDLDDGTSYMKTRCPAWCDRILLSYSAKELLHSECETPAYSMIGRTVCMGDHKPIYLDLRYRHGTDRSTVLKRLDSAEEPTKAPQDNAAAAATADTHDWVSDRAVPDRQIRITEHENTKYIHVRQNGSVTRVFRETSV